MGLITTKNNIMEFSGEFFFFFAKFRDNKHTHKWGSTKYKEIKR